MIALQTNYHGLVFTIYIHAIQPPKSLTDRLVSFYTNL